MRGLACLSSQSDSLFSLPVYERVELSLALTEARDSIKQLEELIPPLLTNHISVSTYCRPVGFGRAGNTAAFKANAARQAEAQIDLEPDTHTHT